MIVTDTDQVAVTLDDVRNMAEELCSALAELAGRLESPGQPEAPVCQWHKVPMVEVQGKRGPFWSCHQRNRDGSFCRFRPNGQ